MNLINPLRVSSAFTFTGRRFYVAESVGDPVKDNVREVVVRVVDRYGAYPAAEECDLHYRRWLKDTGQVDPVESDDSVKCRIVLMVPFRAPITAEVVAVRVGKPRSGVATLLVSGLEQEMPCGSTT